MAINYKLNVGKVVASGTNERFNHFYISILVNANLHSNLLDDKNLLSSNKLVDHYNACGNPIHVELSGGQVHDSKMAKALICSTINNQTKAVICRQGL